MFNYITPIKKYQKIKNKKLKEIKKIKNKKVKKMSSTSIKIQEDALKLRDYLDENNEQLINQFIDTHDENFFLKAKLDEDKKISLFHKIAFSDMTLIFYSVLQKFISKFGNKNSILPQLFSMEDIDGNTPLLFAAFRGNIEIIKELINHGVDYKKKNNSGLNVLHMAAQGDRPNVLIYFKEKYNMNINEVDENGSTPLHWACYMSSEISINYILSWINHNDVNIQDINGKSPLHIAIYGERMKIIKKLINKGGNLSLRDNDGKTVFEICRDNPQLANVFKLITEYKPVKSCLFNNNEGNNQRNIFRCLIFLFLTITIECLTFFVLIPYINNNFLNGLYISFAVALFIITVYMIFSDPGILISNYNLSWLEIVNNKIDVTELCPYCKVKKGKYTKHCHVCSHCIENFDHHCQWINNCVGEKNSTFFVIFLLVLIIKLVLNYIIALKTFLMNTNDMDPLMRLMNNEKKGEPIFILNFLFIKTTKDVLSVGVMTICLFFFPPVCYVLYIQMKNREQRKLRKLNLKSEKSS